MPVGVLRAQLALISVGQLYAGLGKRLAEAGASHWVARVCGVGRDW
jgi:hypothetical protein